MRLWCTIAQPSTWRTLGRTACDGSFDTSLSADAQEISRHELVRYMRTPGSERAMARAERVLPLGVPSSFQFYEPHPLVMRSAAGAHIEDVDGHRYVDFTMGYGSLFTGHSHPVLQRPLHEQIARGTLFVSPCEDHAVVAEMLAARFGLRNGASRTRGPRRRWMPSASRGASPAGRKS